MSFPKPFRFWAFQPDGERAFQAFEHINAYYLGCLLQYERIYELWRLSSANTATDEEAFSAKRHAMQQVVLDIHYLLISLQVIWKTLQRLSDRNFYPNFVAVASICGKWSWYFKQYKEPRNTFEHFDDQVLGSDTRKNGPGYGVKLSSDGGFSLGTQQEVHINQQALQELKLFYQEFQECMERIVGKET